MHLYIYLRFLPAIWIKKYLATGQTAGTAKNNHKLHFSTIMRATQPNKSKTIKKGQQQQNVIKVYILFGELVATEMNHRQKTIAETLNYIWTLNGPQLWPGMSWNNLSSMSLNIN